MITLAETIWVSYHNLQLSPMILIIFLLLGIGALAVTGLNRLKIRPGYLWFLSLGVAIAVWVLLVFGFPSTPQVIPLTNWETAALFSASPALMLDDISWAFGVAVAALLLGVLLTEGARVSEIDPDAWAACIALTGAGLLSIFSGNPLTLLLGWAVLDIAETSALLMRVSERSQSERVVVAFSVKVAGMLLVISAMVRSASLGAPLSFTNIPPDVSGYLVLAAGLRLGVLPPHQAFLKEPPLRRGLGTVLRLAPVAASLTLLVRVAPVGVPESWRAVVLGVAALAGVFGAISWTLAEHELDGRSYWILGAAALAVVSAARGNAQASLFWGLSILLSGGVIFLYSARSRWFSVFPLLGWIGFSALPLSPTWPGLQALAGWNVLAIGLFLMVHALLLLGYYRHVFRRIAFREEIEQWGWVIYPLGLGVVALTQYGVAVTLKGASPPVGPLFSILWWGGVVSLLLGGVFWVLSRHRRAQFEQIMGVFGRAFSLSWLYRFFWWVYRSVSRLVSQAALILEGEGGVLWAVVVLILLVIVIAQSVGGG